VHPTKAASKRGHSAPEVSGSAIIPAPRGPLAVRLRYAFVADEQQGAVLDNPLFELLAAVIEGGSIRHAAQRLGSSYRHVWGALRKWESQFGEPLITWSQGQKARPTAFAEKLMWAERRARTRMQPHIEALRSDLSRVLADARDERHQLLTVRASHDIALPVLQHHVAEEANLHLDIGFQGSVEALRALNNKECLVAGFHVPVLCGAAPVFARALKPLLRPKVHRLIACSRRMQGLMVRKEHAALVRGLPDLARLRLRFVNRQPGSGTRMLVDHLMLEHSLRPGSLSGYHEHIEHTHVAVALCVASGVVDSGLGIEAAALQFGLHFIPLLEENYFLACLGTSFHLPAVERLRKVLAAARWRQILGSLPGYQAAASPGEPLSIEEAFPWWRRVREESVVERVSNP
jgi:putative molybdopterin biosynthesis protein